VPCIIYFFASAFVGCLSCRKARFVLNICWAPVIYSTVREMKCTWLQTFSPNSALHIVYAPLVWQCLIPALHLWKQKMPLAALMQQTMHHTVHGKASQKKTFTLATGCHLWFCLKTEKAWQLWSWKWFRCIQLKRDQITLWIFTWV